MRKVFLLFVWSLIPLYFSAQDTLTIMTYNLLQYGVFYGGCDSNNNDINNKDTYLRQIVGFLHPDILSVNEISVNVSYHDRLLNNVMNADGRTYYARGAFFNYSNSSDITLNVYYNTQKLGLKKQVALATDYRDIILSTFYLKTPQLSQGDTIFLTTISMHLKAGSYSSDATARENMVNVLMNYLNAQNKPGNYLVLGDFNLYTSSEGAFQKLTNHPNTNIRFYDPVNKIGDWSNNSLFAAYHTQSTHSSDNGCAASGGLDDRFDFILTSLPVLSGTQKVKYIPGSYEIVAQDGNHFNKSLLDAPAPSNVPTNVLNALYNNSDHLPVLLKVVAGDNVSVEEISSLPFNAWVDYLEKALYFSTERESKFTFSFYSLVGQLIGQYTTSFSAGVHKIDLPVFNSGAFILLSIQDEEGKKLVRKIFVNLLFAQ